MNMQIRKYYLTKSNNTRRVEKMNVIKYIVITSSIHNGYSALKNRNEIENLKYNQNKEFSCHYIIDSNGEVLNIIPDTERAICTHNLDIDEKSISIMLSLDLNGEYTKEEIETLKNLIYKLMLEYNILPENVIREYDVNCSRRPLKFADESIMLYELINKK